MPTQGAQKIPGESFLEFFCVKVGPGLVSEASCCGLRWSSLNPCLQRDNTKSPVFLW